MGANGLHSSNPTVALGGSPDSLYATCMAPGRATVQRPIQRDPWLPASLPLAPLSVLRAQSSGESRRFPSRKRARHSSGAVSATNAAGTRPRTFRALDLPSPQPPFRALDLPSPQPRWPAASATNAAGTRPFCALDLPSPQPRWPAASACYTREQQPLTTTTNHLVPPPIDPSRGRPSQSGKKIEQDAKAGNEHWRPGVASLDRLNTLTRRERRLNKMLKPKMNMMEGASGVAAGGVVTECRGNLLQQCDGCTKRLEEAVTEKNKGSANCRLSLEDCKREAAERSRDPVADMTGAQQLRIVAHEVGHSWY